jgi:hypothetical protein
MRSSSVVRRAVVSLLMLGLMSVGVMALGSDPAGAATRVNIRGSYKVTTASGGVFAVDLGRKHKFTATGDVQTGAHGTYTYSYSLHLLTFTFTNNSCGTVYSGKGRPARGFKGSATVTKASSGCLPQGTSWTWTSGPVGSGTTSSQGDPQSPGSVTGSLD